MKMKSLALAVTLGLGAIAGSQIAYSDSAQDKLMAAAEAGDADAAYQIGSQLLSRQEGGGPDTERAILYLERAANANHAYAHTTLAQHYRAQSQVPQNRARMLHHYRAAATLGDTNAQTELGRLLLDYSASGDVPVDMLVQSRAQAHALLEHAAKNGNRTAQWHLGHALYHGSGLPKNPDAGIAWLQKAAEQGHGTAAWVVARDMMTNPSSPSYAPVSGVKWMTMAAEAGHQAAMLELVEIYEDGKFFAADLPKAAQWAKRAADAGAPDALAMQARVESKLREQLMAKEAQAADLMDQRDQALAAADASGNLLFTAAPAPAPALPVTTRPSGAPAPVVAATSAPAPGGLQLEQDLPSDPSKLMAYAGELRGKVFALQTENQELRQQVTLLAGERDAALVRVAELDKQVQRVNREIAQLRRGLGQDAMLAEAAAPAPAPVAAVAPVPAARPVSSLIDPRADELTRAGIDAFNAQEYDRARQLFAAAADQGNTEAMNNLATLYMRGTGAPLDIDKAIDLYERAARLGYAPAANNLAFIYTRGEGVPVNPGKARQWRERAAVLASSDSPRVAGRG